MPNNKSLGYIILESELQAQPIDITKNSNGKAVAYCILQTANERNRNGRYYADEDLFPQITAPRTQELIRAGYLRAEDGHPMDKDLQRQSTIWNPSCCARFLDVTTQGNNVMAHAIGTNNELGKAFDADLKEGCLPAWSLRALGSIENTRRGAEVKNLRVITWDCVIYPSHPGAYTQTVSVGESAIITPVNDRPTLVKESTILENAESFVKPYLESDIIRYIQSESSNLQYIRDCFDFIYDSITLSEDGSKVLLTNKLGDKIVVNLENYIYDELSTYGQIKDDTYSFIDNMK